jgi:hypothetical protein
MFAKYCFTVIHSSQAGVAKLADASDLGSDVAIPNTMNNNNNSPP